MTSTAARESTAPTAEAAGPTATGGAVHRRHDLRLVRRPRREEAEPDGRRVRQRQLRDRTRRGSPTRRPSRSPTSSRRWSAPATRPSSRPAAGPASRRRPHRDDGRRGRGRPASARTPRTAARTGRATAAVPRHARTVPAGRGAGDGAAPPVRQLAVALAHAGRARGRLGRTALPPRHLDEPAARRGHHGHPDHRRHAGGLRLVAVGALLRRRGHARHAARLRLHARHGAGRTAPPRSISKSPRASRRSSCSAASWRRAPSGRRARRCAP